MQMTISKWLMVMALSFVICHLSFTPVGAQTLTASAPSHVAVGEQFRLTYTVNTQDASNFRAGDIPDAFEVLMGPSTSSQSSFQMVNGRMSSSSSVFRWSMGILASRHQLLLHISVWL